MSTNPVDLLLMVSVVALTAGVVFLGVSTAYRRQTPAPPPAPTLKPCVLKGHLYRPAEHGWSCQTCGDTVHAGHATHAGTRRDTTRPLPVAAAAR